MTLLLHSRSPTRISISSFRCRILEKTKHFSPVSLLQTDRQTVTRKDRHIRTHLKTICSLSLVVSLGSGASLLGWKLRRTISRAWCGWPWRGRGRWTTLVTHTPNNSNITTWHNNRVNVWTVLVCYIDYTVLYGSNTVARVTPWALRYWVRFLMFTAYLWPCLVYTGIVACD